MLINNQLNSIPSVQFPPSRGLFWLILKLISLGNGEHHMKYIECAHEKVIMNDRVNINEIK